MPMIRPAMTSDVDAIARIDVETWRTAYAGLLPDQLLTGLSTHRRELFWSRFIARRPGDAMVACERDGTVLGFGSCGPQRDNNFDYGGEIFSLYVGPEHQNQGLGRHILLNLFDRLVHAGHRTALLWVLDANPSRFFYERLGGKPVAHQAMEIGQARIASLAYGWGDLSATIRNSGRATSRIG
ncbi:MAG TPA: GNAT family N-acetyltransferase [Stellaceae bacterium]|nr:GNAT family N-acetyltransferase [Stellaceae bacterium]